VTGKDFFEKMIADKAGNTLVLSGNNCKKTEYILKSLEAGYNVLADKPMVIDSAGFAFLRQAFEIASKRHLLLYDIMTERYEITSILQRECAMSRGILGEVEHGSPSQPAIVQTSVHHFYKYVSGKTLTRPPWYFDVLQQGEGIVDVMTHLVDLVQWILFPDQSLDYTKDVQVNLAKRWATQISLMEFKEITKLDDFPSYLRGNIGQDSLLNVYCNGEINYQLRGIHAKTTAIWIYKDPQIAGDTFYSLLRGTKANLVIRQGTEELFKPTLYIEPMGDASSYEKDFTEQFKIIQAKYAGIGLQKVDKGWKVVVSEKSNETYFSHEAHFAQVMQNFLSWRKDLDMPAWEVPNMIAKYYTTTKALDMAKQYG